MMMKTVRSNSQEEHRCEFIVSKSYSIDQAASKQVCVAPVHKYEPAIVMHLYEPKNTTAPVIMWKRVKFATVPSDEPDSRCVYISVKTGNVYCGNVDTRITAYCVGVDHSWISAKIIDHNP